MIRGCTIDAAALAPTAAAVMKRLVKAALASGVQAAKAKAPGVADVPVHQLTIETDAGTGKRDQRSRVVSMSSAVCPAARAFHRPRRVMR